MKRPVPLFALRTTFAACNTNNQDQNVIPADQYKTTEVIHTLPP